MSSPDQPSKRNVYGYIYRLSHPKLWTMTVNSQPHQLCYIGRTEKTVAERFKGHLRDAKKFKGGNEGDGKLHAVMSAQGFSGFIFEELDSAATANELAEKERKYQKKYDSIKHGWNKIIAPTKINKFIVGSGKINLGGKVTSYQSLAHLCLSLCEYSHSNETKTSSCARCPCHEHEK